MKYRILTTPAITEPVTLAEAKAHLQLDTDFTDDDAYITSVISAGRDHIEKQTGRLIAEANVELYLDDFEQEITLPLWPVSTLESVAYKDENGNSQTINLTGNADVILDKHNSPAVIKFLDPPDTYRKEESESVDNVTITFKAGYGSTYWLLPKELKQALLVLIRDMYDNRESYQTKKNYPGSFAVDNILDYYRIYQFY